MEGEGGREMERGRATTAPNEKQGAGREGGREGREGVKEFGEKGGESEREKERRSATRWSVKG